MIINEKIRAKNRDTYLCTYSENGVLHNKILPLLMQPTLEDQERYLLLEFIDRVLYKLDKLVIPLVHKILIVIKQLSIGDDYYARVEGK